jgi:hypothetical protein
MTNMKALTELLVSEIISQAEFDRFEKRIQRAEAKAAEHLLVVGLSQEVEAFVQPGVQYKISDLVLGVMFIKAPCHGYKETADERKFRDGVAKPRMIAALELLGADKHGTGAQTRYSIGQAEAAELEPVVEAENTEAAS